MKKNVKLFKQIIYITGKRNFVDQLLFVTLLCRQIWLTSVHCFAIWTKDYCVFFFFDVRRRVSFRGKFLYISFKHVKSRWEGELLLKSLYSQDLGSIYDTMETCERYFRIWVAIGSPLITERLRCNIKESYLYSFLWQYNIFHQSLTSLLRAFSTSSLIMQAAL